MKKSMIILSAVVLVLSTGLTSCGKSSALIDSSGNEHKIVTNNNGDQIVDDFGNLVEEVERDGKKVTQIYSYPKISTNKSNSRIENAVLSVKVPNGWKTSGSPELFRLKHNGKCVDSDTIQCEVDVDLQTSLLPNDYYDKYLEQTKSMLEINPDWKNLTEFKATLCSIECTGISYHSDSTGMTVYYFNMPYKKTTVEFTVTVYDKCYDKDGVIELINSCCTLKNLGTYTKAAGE